MSIITTPKRFGVLQINSLFIRDYNIFLNLERICVWNAFERLQNRILIYWMIFVLNMYLYMYLYSFF